MTVVFSFPFLNFLASFLNYLFNLDSLHLEVAVERRPLHIVGLVAVRIFSVLMKLIIKNKFEESPSKVIELKLYNVGSLLFVAVVAISDVLDVQGSGPSTFELVFISKGQKERDLALQQSGKSLFLNVLFP